jgi:two-component system, sensor histidine kinase
MKMARILITEDEKLIAEDLKLTLQELGHVVVRVESTGENAVEKARELIPDIVFMDIKLEGELNGIDAAKKIREIIKADIIFCTAYSDDLTLLQLSALNPEGYLTKPFREGEILNTLEKISICNEKEISKKFCRNEFKAKNLILNTI